jgi:tetratricopeptide (TPR) repeat protein
MFAGFILAAGPPVGAGVDAGTSDAGVSDLAASADELSAEGKRLFAQRRYNDAIARFQASNELRPTTATLYNIGKCYERLGDAGLALRHYREYLRLEPKAEHDAAVEQAIGQAESHLRDEGRQQLAVHVEPATARVVIDGALVKGAPAYAELSAGEHQLEVSSEGYVTQRFTAAMGVDRIAEATVTLRPGSPGKATVTVLAPLPGGGRVVRLRPPTEIEIVEARRQKRTAAIALGGTALALLATGVTSGVLALSDFHRAVELQSGPSQAALDEAKAGVTRGMVLANVAYGLAVVAFAVGAYLGFSSGLFESPGAPRITFAPSPGGATLVFSLGL